MIRNCHISVSLFVKSYFRSFVSRCLRHQKTPIKNYSGVLLFSAKMTLHSAKVLVTCVCVCVCVCCGGGGGKGGCVNALGRVRVGVYFGG